MHVDSAPLTPPNHTPIGADRVVAPAMLPATWAAGPVLLERNDYAIIDKDGMVLKASDRSYEFGLLAQEIGLIKPGGTWERTGVAFPPVYRLDATDLASARTGAERLALELATATTIPQFEISDTGHATVEQRLGFRHGGPDRPVVAVLHDASAGAWYAAPLRERPYPILSSEVRDKGWTLRETRTFSAPVDGAVAGVLHLGQWIDLSAPGATATVSTTY